MSGLPTSIAVPLTLAPLRRFPPEPQVVMSKYLRGWFTIDFVSTVPWETVVAVRTLWPRWMCVSLRVMFVSPKILPSCHSFSCPPLPRPP